MRLIANWKKCWKMLSVQVFLVIGLFPDIYNGIASMGWLEELPDTAKWPLRLMAGAGVILRVVQQNNLNNKSSEGNGNAGI